MKMLLFIGAIFFCTSVSAQSFFNQKKTKLKYIKQQIALFQLYTGYVKKGYDIAYKGWSMIDDIKHGDFDLHKDYFNSLTDVNPAISNYSKIDDITTLQQQILAVNDAIKKRVSDNENIQAEEKQYIDKVMSGLLNKCDDNLNELTILTTNGTVKLKDDERLKRIDNLYADMQDKYAFAKSFENTIQILALSRAKNSNDVNTSKLLYGIK